MGEGGEGGGEASHRSTKGVSVKKKKKLEKKELMAGFLPTIVSEAGSGGSLPPVVTRGTAASPSSPCHRGWGPRPG